MSCPTLTLDPHTLTVRPPAAVPPDPADDALAAIASTYEDARAGIISGDPSPAVVPAVVSAGYSPTVPLTLLATLQPTEPPPSSAPLRTVTTVWSRLLRRAEPARRGRHSATNSDGIPADAFRWGPPGRARFLPQAAVPDGV